MRKISVFLPLAVFLAWAVRHLAAPGPQPFLQRWIEVSMAFLLALVFTLGLKNLLLGKPGTPPEKDDDGRDS